MKRVPAWKCPICSRKKVLLVKMSLHLHMLRHIDEIHRKVTDCTDCGNKYASVRAYIEHNCLLEHKVLCKHCGKVLGIGSMPAHEKECLRLRQGKALKCTHCDFECISRREMTSHRQVKHLGYNRKCDHCDESFNTSEGFEKHKDKHRSNTCDQCGKTFNSARSMNEHVQSVHQNIFKFQCNFESCGKKFKGPSQIRRHVLAHDEDLEPYECTTCGMVFRIQSTAHKHQKLEHKNEGTIRQIQKEKCNQLLSKYLSKISPEADAKPKYQRFKRPKTKT